MAERTLNIEIPARDVLHMHIIRSQAARDVLAERQRQIDAEGWHADHDDAHVNGEMAMAAACYAAHSSVWQAIEHTTVKDKPGLAQRLVSAQEFVHRMWPWGKAWWKPKDGRRNLVRAAALILAEIERMDRASKDGVTVVRPMHDAKAERERFEAAYAAIPPITPTKETAWRVWNMARAYGLIAASGVDSVDGRKG